MKIRNLLLYLVLGMTLFLIFRQFFPLVKALGMRIPNPDLVTDYSIAILWAMGLLLPIHFFVKNRQQRVAMSWIWLGKCCVTLGAMLFYEHNYGLDAFRYYAISTQDQAPYFIPFTYTGTRFIGFFSWHLNHLFPVFDSYHSLKVIYSFIGLFGSFFFYKAWVSYFEKENIKWLYLIGFFPTILFWSSILGKDPIVFFAIGLYSLGTIRLLKTQKLKYLILIITGVLIATLVRNWLSFILVAPIGMAYLFGARLAPIKKFIIMGTYIFGIIYFSQSFLVKFGIESTSELLDRTNSLSNAWSIGGSASKTPEFGNLKDLLLFAPRGMFTALFRPLLGEVNNIFGLVAGLENSILLFIFVMSFLRRERNVDRGPVFVWAVTLVLIWAFIYGPISYQNMGTAVRFKLQVIPILLLIIVSFRWTWLRDSKADLAASRPSGEICTS